MRDTCLEQAKHTSLAMPSVLQRDGYLPICQIRPDEGVHRLDLLT